MKKPPSGCGFPLQQLENRCSRLTQAPGHPQAGVGQRLLAVAPGVGTNGDRALGIFSRRLALHDPVDAAS